MTSTSQMNKNNKKFWKTTMCRSVGTPVECPHGNRCNFAHSAVELQDRMCKFEDRCKVVYTTSDGQVRNRIDCKICTAKHPGETSASYIDRTSKITKLPKTCANTKVLVEWGIRREYVNVQDFRKKCRDKGIENVMWSCEPFTLPAVTCECGQEIRAGHSLCDNYDECLMGRGPPDVEVVIDDPDLSEVTIHHWFSTMQGTVDECLRNFPTVVWAHTRPCPGKPPSYPFSI